MQDPQPPGTDHVVGCFGDRGEDAVDVARLVADRAEPKREVALLDEAASIELDQLVR